MKLTTQLLIAVAGACALTALAERFDMKVRNYFFSGFTGNSEALDRGMKICADTLAGDPKNAEALVWHGAGEFFLSGQAFRTGDSEKGVNLYHTGIKEMDEAVALAPDKPAVRIPRGATLLTGSRFVPPDQARPLIEKGLSDFEHTLDIQASYFDQLGTHPRGELLFGLAEGYGRLGSKDKARLYFERIETELKGTPYAKRAAMWLETKSLPRSETGCIGCHTGNE